ncbi:MAG: tryptophan--tRNA ligase [bacterium]
MPRKRRVLSGMRPTGRIHLGNFEGALKSWVSVQDEYECLYMVADWHALTDNTDTSHLPELTFDMVADWLVAGLDPARSTLFIQSHVPEHAELALLLSMVTPISWLERCPTFKEHFRSEKERASLSYGLLGYPVLQAADILIYKAEFVPVGEDQVAHLELSREITRRFNKAFGEVFPEPQPLLSRTSRLLGTDRRKMSKSLDNYISLTAEPDEIRRRTMSMITDTKRIYRSDPGHPDECNVFAFHTLYNDPERVEEIRRGSATGTLPCADCKAELGDVLVRFLAPFREKRREIESDPERVYDVLRDGTARARRIAGRTIAEVREKCRVGGLPGTAGAAPTRRKRNAP